MKQIFRFIAYLTLLTLIIIWVILLIILGIFPCFFGFLEDVFKFLTKVFSGIMEITHCKMCNLIDWLLIHIERKE